MAESRGARLWTMRIAYLALALAIIFFHLLPLETGPVRFAGPDLLMALTFAWAIRRPDYVPSLSIAGAMLLADLLFQRPPGLLALLTLVGATQLKRRAGGMRDAGFAGEWAAAALVVVAVTVLNRLVLAVLAVDQAPLGLTLIRMLMTLAAYPLVALGSHLVLGVRKPAPREDGSMAVRT